MPGLDQTGPTGQGPQTGRGAGYCGGNDAPGYATAGRQGLGGGRRGGGLRVIDEVEDIVGVAKFVKEAANSAIQIHGGEGMSDPELSRLMGMARALRIADGPDEVHRGMVARLELKKYV